MTSNLTVGYIPWENHNSKRYMHPNIHYGTVYNSQDMVPNNLDTPFLFPYSQYTKSNIKSVCF